MKVNGSVLAIAMGEIHSQGSKIILDQSDPARRHFLRTTVEILYLPPPRCLARWEPYDRSNAEIHEQPRHSGGNRWAFLVVIGSFRIWKKGKLQMIMEYNVGRSKGREVGTVSISGFMGCFASHGAGRGWRTHRKAYFTVFDRQFQLWRSDEPRSIGCILRNTISYPLEQNECRLRTQGRLYFCVTVKSIIPCCKSRDSCGLSPTGDQKSIKQSIWK